MPAPLVVGLGAACDIATQEMDFDRAHIRRCAYASSEACLHFDAAGASLHSSSMGRRTSQYFTGNNQYSMDTASQLQQEAHALHACERCWGP